MTYIYSEGIQKYYLNDEGKKVFITDKRGKELWLTNDFVDISYTSKNTGSASLSNYFAYDFMFYGHNVKSVEGVLQSIKYRDTKMQEKFFNLSGKELCNAKKLSYSDDWRMDGYLYLNGKKIDRFDMEYQELLNDLYLAVLNNPSYTNVLISTGDRKLICSHGKTDPTETILTHREFVERLQIIRTALVYGKSAMPKLSELSERIVEDYYQKCYSGI